MLPMGTRFKNGAVWEFWELGRKLQGNRMGILRSKFLPNTEWLLEYDFMLLPSVADRSTFISAVVTHLPLWKNTFFFFCHVWLVFVTEHLTYVVLLNPQSISSLALWIKLAIAWDFSLPLPLGQALPGSPCQLEQWALLPLWTFR